jgi:hypothetical protein
MVCTNSHSKMGTVRWGHFAYPQLVFFLFPTIPYYPFKDHLTVWFFSPYRSILFDSASQDWLLATALLLLIPLLLIHIPPIKTSFLYVLK